MVATEQENKRLQKQIGELTDNVGSRLESETAKLREESDRILMDKEHELILLKAEAADKLSAMEDKCTSLTKALELAQSEVFKLKSQQDKTEVGSFYFEQSLSYFTNSILVGRDWILQLLQSVLKHPEYEETREQYCCCVADGQSTAELKIGGMKINISGGKMIIITSDNCLFPCYKELKTTGEVNKIKDLEEAMATTGSGVPSSLSTEVDERIRQLQSRLEELESDLIDKDNENNVLTSTVHKLRTEHEQQCIVTEQRIRELEESLEVVRVQLSGSLKQLDEQSDYSDIARELALLRSIEFPEEYDQSGRELNRSSSIQSDESDELDQLRQYETESRQQAQEQSELIRLLESDLYRLQKALNEPGRMAQVAPVSASPGQHTPRSSVAVTPAVYEHDNLRESQMLAEAIGEERDDLECSQTEQIDSINPKPIESG
ncbi:unnamed protein product [Echinostoma caproni]|uniref:RUN domain-containing protein n=1 Tax=Echinostoma caproni TaxID=27848 RepID=A0A183AZM4_9TREM|nr:unnamed protein product [Echinostoma caproni]